ncbi:hypothetical protein VPH35_140325 [Triticum aestivum]
MASSLISIPDHLKAEIFVRLPELEDLARTAATCVTFRRVVADGSFRRRFRLLHAPPLLGILDRDGFHPGLPPHPSAPAARALAHAADFTFSFLPSHRRWAVQDIRDGRILLAANPEPQLFTELVVCDPLHQRHILLPQVPHDLAASPEFPLPVAHRCHLFIASPGAGENMAAAAMEEAARAFIVVMIAHCETGVAAFVFPSSTRQWQAAASKGWSDLFPCQGESAMMSSMHPKFVGRHYAYGCFYLESTMNKKLLAFDTRRMEFSIVDVPCETSNMFGLAIVEAGEDMIGMFDIHSDLRYYIRGNKGESSSQWKIKKTISLPSDYQYYIQASTERYLLLRKIGPLQSISSSPKMLEVEYVSMDVKTLQLERVCDLAGGRWRAQRCARLEVVVVLLGSTRSAAVGGGTRRAASGCDRWRAGACRGMRCNDDKRTRPNVARDPASPLWQRAKSLTLPIKVRKGVIWFAPSNIKVYILVFSSSTRQWRAAASQGLMDLLVGEGELTMITPQHPLFLGHYYACGCVYWKWMTNERWKKLLVLDTRSMEFSIADLPLEAWDMADIAIVEAGEDKLGLYGIRDEFADVLCYIVGRKQGENLSHWQTDKTISLDYSYQHCIGATTGRYLLLEREEGSLFRWLGLDSINMEYFSLDVETLHLERVCDKPIASGTSRTYLYTNFPPPLLSAPTI